MDFYQKSLKSVFTAYCIFDYMMIVTYRKDNFEFQIFSQEGELRAMTLIIFYIEKFSSISSLDLIWQYGITFCGGGDRVLPAWVGESSWASVPLLEALPPPDQLWNKHSVPRPPCPLWFYKMTQNDGKVPPF